MQSYTADKPTKIKENFFGNSSQSANKSPKTDKELPKEVDSSETSKKEPEMYVYFVQIDRTNETKLQFENILHLTLTEKPIYSVLGRISISGFAFEIRPKTEFKQKIEFLKNCLVHIR